MSRYFGKWRLKTNVSKTVSCVFHLNNQQATRQLKLRMNGRKIKHEKHPKYLGVILDRSLTYRPHLVDSANRLKPRIHLVQKLAGSNWGCSGKTLRITTQAMVKSVASYCAPVWMHSCHVKKVDTQINSALRIICGAVQPTELEWLYVLSNITPAHISREEAAIKECKKIANDPDLPIYKDIDTAPDTLRLRSRKPIWCFYRKVENMDLLKDRWKAWWQETSVYNKDLIQDPTEEVKGMDLPRRTWKRLNRIRTGQGCCASLLHKWKVIDSPLCQCGQIQTIDHIVSACALHKFSGTLLEIHQATDDAVDWLRDLAIDL
ncbi:uncharacterized protein LOC119084960 [Bradysia coprophila]|uniref:uncharacterized protein LOC119084960 n=1 Tax=Bradysia coprophila TaxID=38358 RepID=UPI00187D8601|nr:uncharacterized protein LOC119084960 [Bradysia coprophila]